MKTTIRINAGELYPDVFEGIKKLHKNKMLTITVSD